MEITYPKGENASLYFCCEKGFLFSSSCKVAICPKNKTIENCKTRKRKVCCEINHVQDKVTMQAYVGWFDGKKVVQLSGVATYVTNKAGMKYMFHNTLTGFVLKVCKEYFKTW